MVSKTEKRSPELIARGERLKKIRKSMLRMTVNEFAALCESGESTVSQWENARVGGLTEKSARHLVEALKKVDVQCSEAWLLYGEEGNENQPPRRYSEASSHGAPFTLREDIKAGVSFKEGHSSASFKPDIELFTKSHPQAVVVALQDDAMLPFFRSGDVVGGYRLSEALISELLGEICIVQTFTGQILVRRLEPGKEAQTYRLSAINTFTKAEPFVLETEVVSVAMITRLWRPCPYL